MATQKPQYKHDCNKCIFLGRYRVADKETQNYYPGNKSVDLYYCKGSGIVARYGNEGSEYSSAPVGCANESKNNAHKDAELRAKDKGLLSNKELVYLAITDRQARDKIIVLEGEIEPYQAKLYLDILHMQMVFNCGSNNEIDLFQNPHWRLACLSLEQAMMNLELLQKEMTKNAELKNQLKELDQARGEQVSKNYDYETDIKDLKKDVDRIKCGF
jgi:hypothetical protein